MTYARPALTALDLEGSAAACCSPVFEVNILKKVYLSNCDVRIT